MLFHRPPLFTIAFLVDVADEPSELRGQDKAETNHFLPSTIARNFASLRNCQVVVLKTQP